MVDTLVEGMFSRFGVPETIHSDQGRNFESQVFAIMCERLGAYKTCATPLLPQSDRLVETFHCTLRQQLAILIAQHQREWDDHLPVVLMACRSAVQETTSCTSAPSCWGDNSAPQLWWHLATSRFCGHTLWS